MYLQIIYMSWNYILSPINRSVYVLWEVCIKKFWAFKQGRCYGYHRLVDEGTDICNIEGENHATPFKLKPAYIPFKLL